MENRALVQQCLWRTNILEEKRKSVRKFRVVSLAFAFRVGVATGFLVVDDERFREQSEPDRNWSIHGTKDDKNSDTSLPRFENLGFRGEILRREESYLLAAAQKHYHFRLEMSL
jgi:hypothetical protein